MVNCGMWTSLADQLKQRDNKALSRAISLVENGQPGYEDFLASLDCSSRAKITGITGPPGAGKSTLVDTLVGCYIARGESVAILCVDPSSAFTGGALLGDRIRMRQWYDHPKVYIRSLSTRGALGGLNHAVVEITDVLRAAAFDNILIETVGVGQSEIEIAGIADITVVVQVPEGGDEVQTMKAGLMEIADIFVVNKCDRPGADDFVNDLRMMLHDHDREVSVIKTIASTGEGIDLLAAAIDVRTIDTSDLRKIKVLLRRALQLIMKKKMQTVDAATLEKTISERMHEKEFNLYRIIRSF